jgi:hypothetical protein
MGETCLTLLTSLHTAQARFLRDCTTRIDDQQTHRRFSLRIRGADGLHVLVWNCRQTTALPCNESYASDSLARLGTAKERQGPQRR